MPRLRLRAKLLISFILILLPVLGLLIYNDRQAYEGRTQTILDDQLLAAQAFAALVDASIDEAIALGWAIANDPLTATFDPSVLDPHLQRLAARYPQYETISVANAAGDSVGSMLPFAPDASRKGLAADRPYFQQVMASGEPAVSDVLISRRTGRPTFVAAVPVKSAGGTTIGAIIAALYLQELSGKLENAALRPRQRVLLTDRAGTVAFLTGSPDIPWEQRNLGDFEPVKAALAGRPTQARGFESPIMGDRRIGAFTATPKFGWVVGVTESEELALAPIRTVLRNQLIVFAAVVVLSIGLVAVFSYFFLQPIRTLAKHALAVAGGQFEQRVYVKTGDELEGLAQTFNYMAEQLQRRDEENAMLSRLKDEFLSVAAHELKTPVTSIKGYAQYVLQREHEGVSPAGLRALEAVNRGSDRIARLVNDLLEISRIHMGRLEFESTKFDLSQLVTETVERVALTAGRHKLLTSVPGPIYVAADRERIEQVLDNLLDNAIKFSPSEGPLLGTIDTAVQVIDGQAVVSVRDSGVGIPKERQTRIFERFYRAHFGTPYDYGGMGIGLYLSREIVDRHGGRMWFESEEGKGSTFHFALPLARPQGEMGKRGNG